MKKVLWLDLETRGVQHLYDMEPKEQMRLAQWSWNLGNPVHTTTSFEKINHVVDQADVIVGHNIFYDLTVLWGKDSIRTLEMALEGRILDTFVLYPLKFRIPKMYDTCDGKRATTYADGKQKPELVKRFLSLGNLTHRHGLPGKEGDIIKLAKKFNPKGTKREDLDFGLIPTDDKEFLDYAINDIVAVRALGEYILNNGGGFTQYDYREMLIAAINNQIGKNGFRVDAELAQSRVDDLNREKEETLAWLHEHFDFPLEGKKPWQTKEGKQAILKAFESFGITPQNSDWPKSPKTGEPSFGKEILLSVAKGTPAESMAQRLGKLVSQRSLAQLALDSMWSDGYVHPQITSLQKSGRFSMTGPSLPIWGSRTDDLAEDKRYFIASPGCKLVEQDFSNADQRIVAALSGDKNYAKRFEPGVDGHEVSGRLMFGDDEYESNSDEYRHIAKALSHAFAYGAGVQTLARTSRLPESEDPEKTPEFLAQKFVDAMNHAYPGNKRWRAEAAKLGSTGWVTNSWGRRMAVEPERSYTQAPGLLGQAGTREILCDGLIRIAKDNVNVIRWLVATVHDAVIWDIPEKDLEWAVPWITERMETIYDPGGIKSQPIYFPISSGKPSDNWKDASHG